MIHKSLNKVWSFLVQKFSIKNIAPFSSRIGEIRKILVDLLILIICILSIIIVYRELKTPYVIFEPFQVPEEIEKQGLTGRAVASKLIDQIVVMRANPETTMFAPREKGSTFIQSWRQVKFEAVIPGSGITLDSILIYVKGLIGRQPISISGEIVKQERIVEVSVRVDGNYAKFPSATDTLEDGLHQAARHVLKYTQPSILATYLYQVDKHDCLNTIKHLLQNTRDEDDSLAYILWGKILSDQKDFEGATEKFKIVQNIDPKQHYLYNNWGVSLLRKGDYKEAVDKFMRAIFIDPLNPNNYIVYANWGSALLQDGKLSEADLKFRKTRELRPDIDFSDIERKSIRQLR
ncbi:hypothetical protein D3OALGB2SA_5516 [Olavius algarvensis associated proteobacterium Delta 3]|nr:hypothetical protein D3OALGB2SA_5516 [Olavius algarvensis associated proteobacterium Delta 3]